jgi:hypothetical protein
MRRLAAQNLAEPQPSRPVQWLFHSHPPIQERIEHAQRFDRLTVPRSGGEGDQAANSRSGLQED